MSILGVLRFFFHYDVQLCEMSNAHTKRIALHTVRGANACECVAGAMNVRQMVGTIIRKNSTELLHALTAKVVQKDRISTHCGW